MNILPPILQNLLRQTLGILDRLEFLPLLGLRIWIGFVFWQSGMSKLNDWPSTLALFQDEYRVPFLPYELAAQFATAAELAAPILLLIGLGTRGAAAVLLVMTLVIEFTYMSFPVHQIWALVLLLLITRGAGPASIDFLLRRKFLAA